MGGAPQHELNEEVRRRILGHVQEVWSSLWGSASNMAYNAARALMSAIDYAELAGVDTGIPSWASILSGAFLSTRENIQRGAPTEVIVFGAFAEAIIGAVIAVPTFALGPLGAPFSYALGHEINAAERMVIPDGMREYMFNRQRIDQAILNQGININDPFDISWFNNMRR